MLEAIILSVCMNYTCDFEMKGDHITIWTTKPVVGYMAEVYEPGDTVADYSVWVTPRLKTP